MQCFLENGDMCLWAIFQLQEIMKIFDMFFGNCTEIRMDAYQYTNYKSNDLLGRIYKSTHSNIQKGMDSHWDKDLLCLPAVQSKS